MSWEVGQTVEVQSRTWAGINKPGGCAKITKIHYDTGSTVEGLDVKYVLGGGCEKNIDPAIVSHFETLQRGGRKRRGREFLLDKVEDVKQKIKSSKNNNSNKKTRPLPSPQPTSPSTPTTPPEHNRKQQKQTKATKVTPIPSYVTTDQTLDVSPLDRNIKPSKGKTKEPVARRGLFEMTNAPITASLEERQHLNSVAAAALFKRSEEKRKISIAKCRSLKLPAVYETPTNIDNKTNQCKPKSSLRGSPALNLQLPRPQPKAATNGKSVPLERVFQKEKQKARDFMDSVMGARSEDVINGDKAEAPKKPSRFEQFLSIFQVIRLRIDDGVIEEIEFEKLVNAQAEASADITKSYSKQELDSHLETLSGQGKVMKSEGTIYIID